MQLQLAWSPFGVKDGLNTPNVINAATATLRTVSIVFFPYGAGILPLASLRGAKLPSPLLGPGQSNHSPQNTPSGPALKVDLGVPPIKFLAELNLPPRRSLGRGFASAQQSRTLSMLYQNQNQPRKRQQKKKGHQEEIIAGDAPFVSQRLQPANAASGEVGD